MARQMSATRRDGLATFLLEMALDKARMKARLAAVLADERRQRGKGDPRRFPQPEMAALLGYSLRQYQRLEDESDPSLPSWDDLNAILEKLGRDAGDIFADDDEPADAPPATPDRAEAGVEETRELRALVEALLRAEGIDPAEVLRDARLRSEEHGRAAGGLEAPGEAA